MSRTRTPQDAPRTGVVLVTHGSYGAQMVAAAEAIAGPLDLALVCLPAGVGRGEICARVEDAVAASHRGDGVVVLADIYGSTPANVCQEIVARTDDVELVTGVNLPMLLKLAVADRGRGAAALAGELVRSARRSVALAPPGDDDEDRTDGD